MLLQNGDDIHVSTLPAMIRKVRVPRPSVGGPVHLIHLRDCALHLRGCALRFVRFFTLVCDLFAFVRFFTLVCALRLRAFLTLMCVLVFTLVLFALMCVLFALMCVLFTVLLFTLMCVLVTFMLFGWRLIRFDFCRLLPQTS